MPCPDENALLDFARGQLGDDAASAIERHLDECDLCRALVAEAAGGPARTPSVGEAAPDPAEPPAAFPKLGRYAVLELISAGGMGVVYAAYDPELDRKVALKVLRPQSRGAESLEQAQGRLLLEAKAMARLAHPNIVAVHDAGVVGSQVFLAMELVEGGTLAEWLRARPRAWPEALELFLQAGRGLAAAHAGGIVHGDFKPDNVLVGGDGRARVTDFGLARPVVTPEARETGEAAGLPAAGRLAGTPAYMAPEQFAGAAASARADQYSFCVALWEALYGRRPFSGATITELAAVARAGELPPPPPGSSVPAWLHRALTRGLSVDPEQRFPFLEGLLAALSSNTALRRKRAWIAAVAVALAGAAAVTTVQLARSSAARCESAGSQFSQPWSLERQQVLHDAFVASGAPHSQKAWENLAQAVNERVRDWSSLSRERCVAGAEPSACLELQSMELEALLDRLARADARIVERIALVQEPVSPVCALDASALPPAARSALALAARARAEHLAGGPATALPLALEAAGALQRLGDRRLESAGLLLLSSIEAEAGQGERAEADAVSAAIAAEAAGAPGLAAWAWLQRLRIAGHRRLGSREAKEIARHVSAFAEAAGEERTLEADLSRALGEQALAAGEAARAGLFFEQELRQRAEASTRRPNVLFGEAHALRAAALAAQGKPREALRDERAAVTELESALWAGHPRAVEARLALAERLLALGSLEEAREAFDAAATSLASASAHPCLAARAEAGAAQALSALGEEGPGLERLERAAAQDLNACPLPKLGLLVSLGELLQREAMQAEAAVFLEQAATLATSLGRKHEAAVARLRLGWCKLALGEPGPAIAPLQEAVEGLDGREQQQARAALASALWRQGDDRGRARALAREAGVPVSSLATLAPSLSPATPVTPPLAAVH